MRKVCFCGAYLPHSKPNRMHPRALWSRKVSHLKTHLPQMCRTPSALRATVGHEESPQSSPQCPSCSRRAALCEAALRFGAKKAHNSAGKWRNRGIGAKTAGNGAEKGENRRIGAKKALNGAGGEGNKRFGAKKARNGAGKGGERKVLRKRAKMRKFEY